MKILCTICARGGSSNLKNKNTKIINRNPLIAYTINIALKSKIFEDIIISSDSKKIINIAKKYGINKYIYRSKKLSTDHSIKLDVIKDCFIKAEKMMNKKYEYICDLDVTSPLRTVNDLKNCSKIILKKNVTNLFSVTESRKNPYFNIIEKKNNGYKPVSKKSKFIYNRQQAPKVYDMNASIYMWKRENLLKVSSIFQKNSAIYLMDNYCIDIDDINDFNYVKQIIENNKKWKI